MVAQVQPFDRLAPTLIVAHGTDRNCLMNLFEKKIQKRKSEKVFEKVKSEKVFSEKMFFVDRRKHFERNRENSEIVRSVRNG